MIDIITKSNGQPAAQEWVATMVSLEGIPPAAKFALANALFEFPGQEQRALDIMAALAGSQPVGVKISLANDMMKQADKIPAAKDAAAKIMEPIMANLAESINKSDDGENFKGVLDYYMASRGILGDEVAADAIGNALNAWTWQRYTEDQPNIINRYTGADREFMAYVYFSRYDLNLQKSWHLNITDVEFTDNDAHLTYSLAERYKNGSSSRGAAITGYDGNATDLHIPASVKLGDRDIPVMKIGPDVFKGKDITSLVIPEGVKVIGKNAFANSKLTTVTLPDNIDIDDGAFANTPLTTVKFSGKGDMIKFYTNCFNGCDKLTSIDPKYKFKEGSADDFAGTPLGAKAIEAYIAQQKTTDDKATAVWNLLTYSNDYRDNYGSSLAKKLRAYAAQNNTRAQAGICAWYLKGYFNDPVNVTGAEFFRAAKALSAKNLAVGHGMLGLAYEKGIGCTPSRSMAHTIYARGRDMGDEDCENGWWRTF